MKKCSLILLVTIITTSFVHGQDYMYIHQKGGIVQKISMDQIDSILFYNAATLNGYSVQGFAQKGPFINGSSVTIFDLNSDLTPTGKTYNAQIKDHLGTFSASNIGLSSNLVSLRADGFYFNEVLGEPSTSQITLYALTDVSNRNNVNINLLTHLEKPRVEFLMKAGQSFSEAKKQAQKEILDVFSIQKDSLAKSEDLNIALPGDENGILLAISSILQGFRSESELTELLSNIGEDLRTDGILSNSSLGSELINHALFLDSTAIKNQLTKRYQAVGSTSDVPNIGPYLNHFVSNTHFTSTKSLIDYPSTGSFGKNILSLEDTLYARTSGTKFSLAAKTPTGVSLAVRITSLPDTIHTLNIHYEYRTDTTYLPNGQVDTIHIDSVSVSTDAISVNFAGWGYSSNMNWVVSSYGRNPYKQTFTTFNSGVTSDLLLDFPKTGRFLIEYFENQTAVARRKKIIRVQAENTSTKYLTLS